MREVVTIDFKEQECTWEAGTRSTSSAAFEYKPATNTVVALIGEHRGDTNYTHRAATTINRDEAIKAHQAAVADALMPIAAREDRCS
ncbi:MAG: hypothetical protein AB7I52_17480 [Rhizobiaceae bacterium]